MSPSQSPMSKVAPLQPVKTGTRVALTDAAADRRREGDPNGDRAERLLTPLIDRLDRLQRALYAESQRCLLVVLQGRDAAGKDGLIRNVFGPLNSQGCVVSTFKRPTSDELARDYLWRVHLQVPPRGTIGVFNRSHYEDVLPVRVHNLVPKKLWSKRYGQINDFEKMLSENGVTILKFLLHVSRAEQKQRLLERLHDPTKNWKFQVADLEERKHWTKYTRAHEDMLALTSTPWAPWYVVPADRKKARDLRVAATVVAALERMAPAFPTVDREVLKLTQQWEHSDW
jgi:PPK2 family polyphosphate:nucleotide phosphotransferase